MTTALSNFSPLHIPPLVIATGFTLGGGLLPLWNSSRAMREYGLPERFVASKQAHTPFILYGNRTSIIGAALWIFYFRQDYRSVDTIMSLLFWAGAADGYLCWKEGVPGRALFRFTSSLFVAGWGLLGLTSRG
ncbi:efflux pump antibiotic resistance [Fusarium albosuccineum]|uniref:Efflux pump antibiotic resistance n=1 Tax=Fusarium albosuccineum TaxID=1237068 RepID=A0A8H4PLC4_9HYPO|nr:efflux pump antibiotic resistance [Fusarium albosuccineum]